MTHEQKVFKLAEFFSVQSYRRDTFHDDKLLLNLLDVWEEVYKNNRKFSFIVAHQEANKAVINCCLNFTSTTSIKFQDDTSQKTETFY